MDFIEQLFGLSPDNGDGSTEVLWLVVFATLLGAAIWWQRERVAPLLQRRFLRERGIGATLHDPWRFTSIARMPIGSDQEGVIVTSQMDVDCAADLIGATVFVDGVRCVVDYAVANETPIRKGQRLMLRIRKCS